MLFSGVRSRIFLHTTAPCSGVFTNRNHARRVLHTLSHATNATLQQETPAPDCGKSAGASVFTTPAEMVVPSDRTATISSTRNNASGASTQQLFLGQRVWDEIPYWCSLCVEPLNVWNEHVGKREHVCLEMFYDALIRYERRWDPRDVWAGADDVFCYAVPPIEAHNTVGETSFGLPPSSSSALDCAFRAFDQGTRARRHELVACLHCLISCGIIQLDTNNLNHASFIGSLVLFKEQFSPLSQLFPLSNAKDVSCLTQMIAANYNFETVFDLCRMEALVPAELLQARRAHSSRPQATDTAYAEEGTGLYGDNNGDIRLAAGSFPSEFDAEDSVCEKASEGGISYNFKGVFCRALLGALRWSLEPDSGDPPAAIGAPELAHKSGMLTALSAHTARLLISEIIDCKLTEYVVRVEGVFREERGLAEATMYRFGNCKIFHPHASPEPNKKTKRKERGKAGDTDQKVRQVDEATKREQLRLARKARAIGQPHYAGRSEVVPSLSNWGMLQYMDGILFYNEAFSSAKGDASEIVRLRTRRLVSNG